MLNTGRIDGTEAEHAAVDKLIGEHDGESVFVTRRDPGDTGPMIVQVGDLAWEISEDGKRKKVT